MVEGGVIVEPEVGGWMRRCVLIGAVRQSDVWIAALQAAAEVGGEELVLLSERPSEPSPGDEGRIFLASDHRYFGEASDAECVAVLDGVDRFAGISHIPEDHARIQLIEISRHAVEAMCWTQSAAVVTSAAADAARHGEPLSLLGLSVRPPELHPMGHDAEDRRAVRAIAYLQGAAAFWCPLQFIYDRPPAELREDVAVLDMTGPPRSLFRGPYLWAPIGRWRIKARFSVDAEGAQHRIQFRWGPPLKPTILEVDLEKSGIYNVELVAEWEEIDGMELTVALLHGCIAGEFSFLGATVSQPNT